MTKLNLNNLTFDGGSIPDSPEALHDQILDYVKTCKKEKLKVPVPKSPTPYSELVRCLIEKKILASNDLSGSENEEEVEGLRAQHKAQVQITVPMTKFLYT